MIEVVAFGHAYALRGAGVLVSSDLGNWPPIACHNYTVVLTEFERM